MFHKLKLILCRSSGEDYKIIELCNENRIINSFSLIGLFVLFIFAGCWASASLFVSHLFEGSILISTFVGIVWATLVTNLYLLLLYTISPSLLPVARHTKAKQLNTEKDKIEQIESPESPFTSSFVFRLSLITLLATIITQPFNVLIFSPSFEEPNFYAGEIRSILSNRPSAWLITIFGCVLFLLPVYWKYAIRNRGGFYEKKRHIENKFVHDNYTDFKEQYSAIFKDKISEYNRKTWENLMPVLNKLQKINPENYEQYFEILKAEMEVETIVKYEYWADPPFRTIRKKLVRNLSSEIDFLEDIYSKDL